MNSALSSLQVSLASGVVGQACGDGLLVSVEGVLTLVCGTTFCDLIGDLAIGHWGELILLLSLAANWAGVVS